MKSANKSQVMRLEDLPNVGRSIAADLRGIGIQRPEELAHREPLEIFDALAATTGHRHDPCVLYTLMSVRHFLDSGQKRPWWKFTEKGKAILANRAAHHSHPG